MTTDNTPATLATVKHGGCVQLGHEQRSDLVPGVVRCAKCAFQLHRTNLYLQSGTVGAGDSKTEPCPNGCGPLWPVTWETWAREGWAEAERLHLEMAALSAQPSPGGQDAARYERLFLSAVGMLTKISLRLGLEPNSDGVEPMLAAIDALAARQPVGEVIAWHWPSTGVVCSAEAVNRDRAPTDNAVPLYDAPPALQPAQAVDLGQFQPMVDEFRRNWANYGRTMTAAGKDTSKARQNVDEADRLLALIYSQAVGK
ncbi:TPA: hypothetical protein ACOEOK_000851 [Stenotrophomonas maltophilia]